MGRRILKTCMPDGPVRNYFLSAPVISVNRAIELQSFRKLYQKSQINFCRGGTYLVKSLGSTFKLEYLKYSNQYELSTCTGSSLGNILSIHKRSDMLKRCRLFLKDS